MADWRKKFKHVLGDLAPSEQLLAGVFANPPGAIRRATAKGVGGLVGAAISDRVGGAAVESAAAGTFASTMPEGPVWIGVTERRIVCWSHGQMMGKPKQRIAELDRAEIAGVSAERQKATYALSIRFVDGSVVEYEAPRIGGDTQHFVDTLLAASA